MVIRLTTAVMKATIRGAGVVIAISSWIAMSNHCAFALIATENDSTQAGCPFHSKPAKQKQQAAQVQCCKTLRAVVLAQTKAWARDDAKFLHLHVRSHEFAPIALQRNAQVALSLDTGPPDARSFAELILQRSLLAHAPPFSV